ncbi:MAG TPA: cobalamin-binding protein [Caldimonas sp.]|jgi:iron complex transport system substrate-binding protein
MRCALPALFARLQRAIVAAMAAGATLAAPLAVAAITVVDDAGRRVVLDRPPERVVTLAPSLTELVFAAGAGSTLVGVSALSDYPPAARGIARIGDAGRVDVERVLELKPDLVLVWQRGNLSRELEQLARAGIQLFQLEPQRLDDVARAIERLGTLLGHEREARRNAESVRAALAQLRAGHAGAAPVTVFYQVWQQPLMTVNRQQIVNDILGVCGGRNVFADLAPLVPIVSTEAVVAADPEAILTASEQTGSAAWRRDPANPGFALWRPQPRMTAVRHGWLYALDGDAISRQGPRIVDGAVAVCAVLDEVRRERAAR